MGFLDSVFGEKDEEEKKRKKLYKKAKKLSKNGKYEEAMVLCNKILENKEDYFKALYVKGKCQMKSYDCEEAINTFNRALDVYPDSSDDRMSKFEYKVLFSKVKIFNKTGKFLEANEILDSIIQYYPDKRSEEDIFLAKAIALKGIGNYSDANLYFSTVIAKRTKRIKNNKVTAWIREANDSYLSEIETIEPPIEYTNPDINFDDLVNNFNILKEKDEYTLEDAENFIIYGDQYKILNDYDKSIENYEIAIEILRNHYNMSKSENTKEALYNAIISKMNVVKIILNFDQLNSLDEAIELYPDKPDAWIIKSDWKLLTLRSIGKIIGESLHTEAVETYEKAREMDPKNPITPVKQAILTEYCSPYFYPKEESFKLLDQATSLNPKYSFAFLLKGKKILDLWLNRNDLGNLYQAQECFQKVNNLNPNDKSAIIILGLIERRLKGEVILAEIENRKILGLPFVPYTIWDFSRGYDLYHFGVAFQTHKGTKTVDQDLNIGITTGFLRY